MNRKEFEKRCGQEQSDCENHPVKVKAKIKGTSIEIEKSFDYYEPTSIEAGMDVDGEKDMLALYLNERKTTFMDIKRQKLDKALMKEVAKQINSGDLEIELDA